MIQMKNNLILVISVLLFGACITDGREYENESKGNSNELQTDTFNTTKLLYQQIVQEAPEYVYKFINGQNINHKLCSKYNDNIVVINITVRDTLIVSGSEKVYEFDKTGNLINYTDNSTLIVDLFLLKSATNFEFIDNYAISFYDFRIEMEKICIEK